MWYCQKNSITIFQRYFDKHTIIAKRHIVKQYSQGCPALFPVSTPRHSCAWSSFQEWGLGSFSFLLLVLEEFVSWGSSWLLATTTKNLNSAIVRVNVKMIFTSCHYSVPRDTVWRKSWFYMNFWSLKLDSGHKRHLTWFNSGQNFDYLKLGWSCLGTPLMVLVGGKVVSIGPFWCLVFWLRTRRVQEILRCLDWCHRAW